MIITHDLTKHYGSVAALQGLNLQVEPGMIYALLGPNGAGKTTTISILTTLTLPSSGSAQVAGHDVVSQAAAVRSAIGVTFQDLILDQDLTGRQVLNIHGRLYNQASDLRQRRIDELVSMVQLKEAIDRRVKSYSGGMKRRLELARGLMTNPKVLFLDEPTQGLDPQNRAIIWEYLQQLRREQGLTILLTTHAMEEAEALADQVGIIDQGRMIAEGSAHELASALGADVIRIIGSADNTALIDMLKQQSFVEKIHYGVHERTLYVSVDSSNRRLADIVGMASSAHYQIEELSVTRPSLGDVFLQLTGHALRDELK